jgi:hypothetical protein
MASAQTVVEFCDDHRISRSCLYELWACGEGPRKMRVGRKILIKAEDAEAWRLARMEKAEDVEKWSDVAKAAVLKRNKRADAAAA